MVTHRRLGILSLFMVLALVLAACQGGGGTTGSPAATTGGAATDGGAASPDETAGGEASPAATEEGGAGNLEACGDPESGDELLIGVVTDIGRLEDRSFNEVSWCGAMAGAESVGGTAEVIVTENVDDYAQNIQTFIDRDFDVIVTVGFLIGTDTLAAAQENPDVQFIGVDQFIAADPPPDNYQGILFAERESGYLAGIVAGSITETNVIAAVGGQSDVPPVVDFIGGYHNGALSANPDVEVLVSYTETFTDPALGRSTAEQLIDQDADVIFQVAGGTGAGALEAACEAGIYGIGVDVDQAISLPDQAECIVTSAEKKIKEAVQAAIERIADGTAEGGNVFNSAASDPPGIGLAPYHEFEDLITPEIQAAVDEAFEAMAAGELDPCEGPGVCTGE